MELKTGKVIPTGGESTGEIVQKLCVQFALLIDEMGFYVTKLSQQNKELEEKLKELSESMTTTETEGG